MPVMLATGDPAASRDHLSSRGARGFTLIEMLVALAIMILVAASLPVALNRMIPARRAATTADRLVSDIRWLQEQSIGNGAITSLDVLPAGYRLNVPGKLTKQIDLTSTTSLNLRGLGEERPLTHLTIFPDGTTSAGRFEVMDSGRRALVEVSMLTGRARRLR